MKAVDEVVPGQVHTSLNVIRIRKNKGYCVANAMTLLVLLLSIAFGTTLSQEWMAMRPNERLPESAECTLYKPTDIAFVGNYALVVHSEGKALSRYNLVEGTCTPTRYITLADVHRQVFERDQRRRRSPLHFEVLDLDGLVRADDSFRELYTMPSSLQRVFATSDSTFCLLLNQMAPVCGESDSYYTLIRQTHASELHVDSEKIRIVTPDNAVQYWPAWHSLYVDTAGTYWFSTFLLDNHAKVFDAQPFLCAFDSDGVPLSRCVYLPVEAARRKGYVYLQNSLVELHPGLVATVSVRYPQLVVFDTESLQSVAFDLDTVLPPRGPRVASRAYEFVASNQAGTIEYVFAYNDSSGTRISQWLIRHTIDRSDSVATIVSTELEPVPLTITLGPGASATKGSGKTAGERMPTIRRLVMHDDEWYVVTTGLRNSTE